MVAPTVNLVAIIALLSAQTSVATNGAGGALPEVESVLSQASDTVKDFTAQAATMQQRVAQKQAASRAALAAQKAAYEDKLTAQEEANEELKAAIVNINSAIASVRDTNSGLKSDAAKLQKSNALLRDALNALGPKITTAKEFLSDSLRMTDDANADVLKILMKPTPEPTLDHFLEVAQAEDEPVALLELSGHVKAALREPINGDEQKPEDLVKVLQEGLMSLEAAQQEGEAQLKAHFLAMYEVGDKKHADLIAKQKSLNETRTSEETLRTQLIAAKKHLVETRGELKRRIHGIRVFAQKADETAAKALKDAEALANPKAAQSKPTQGASQGIRRFLPRFKRFGWHQ